RALIVSHAMEKVALELAERIPGVTLLSLDGALGPYASFDDARRAFPATPVADETPGGARLYSSGTPGQPTGGKRPLPGGSLTEHEGLIPMARELYGMDETTVYLSPAPLYHAAPLNWSMNINRMGGTAIVMEKFDAEQCLALIQKHAVTHAQFVPTHFVRMLKLPADVRAAYDHSSLRSVFHAAAPCP